MAVAIALLATPGREEVETVLNVHTIAARLIPGGVLGGRARTVGIGDGEVGQSERDVESSLPYSRSTVHRLDNILPSTLGGVELLGVCTVSRHTNKGDLACRRAALSISNRVRQVRDGASAASLVTLSLVEAEDVGEIHSTPRLRALAHGGIHGMVGVGVEVESVGMAAGRLVSLVQTTLQVLVHESVLGVGDV